MKIMRLVGEQLFSGPGVQHTLWQPRGAPKAGEKGSFESGLEAGAGMLS